MSAVYEIEIEGYQKAEEKLSELYKGGAISEKSLKENTEELKAFHNEDGEQTMFKFIVADDQNLDICYAPPMSMTY